MLIRMDSVSASANGIMMAGREYYVEDSIGQGLVSGGYAVRVDTPPAPEEEPVIEAPEIVVEPETLVEEEISPAPEEPVTQEEVSGPAKQRRRTRGA